MEKKSAFFDACASGDIITATDLVGQLDLSLEEIVRELEHSGFINIIKNSDEKGDTALHLAVREYQLDMVKILVELDASLCDCANKVGENPLKLAVSLGFDEVVEFLVTRTSNALHYIVELNQVGLLEYLMDRKIDLSNVINQGYKPLTNPSDNEGNRSTNPQHVQTMDRKERSPTDAQDDQPIVVTGDTPLHIAARNKYQHMVNLLLKVPGVNKLIRNSEKKTPFQIAREVIEYHESYWTIRKLGDFRQGPKGFMYCAPQVSHKKYKKALSMLNKAYEERRNAELVVAALLATMTCAALFTVPGGFYSESPVKGDQVNPIPSPSYGHDDEGSPVLISLVSFKLFIVFDCIAFFLSLFVCIMWEMSSVLTTRDKMMHMTLNSLLVCLSFGFTACGVMSAVYAMLARKVWTFSWKVLAGLIAISFLGFLAFIHQFQLFVVKRARTDRLIGASNLGSHIVEKLWCGAECCGLPKFFRLGNDFFHDVFTAHCRFKWLKYSHSSPSCCFNQV